MARRVYLKEWLTDDNLIKLAAWARDGLTDANIAKKIGITPTTLWSWKKKEERVADALKRGKEVVDIEVENALLDNARGFFYTEQVALKVKDIYYDEEGRKCSSERIEVATIQRYSKPVPVAQFFWLQNRKSDVWRDKQKEASDVTDGRITGIAFIPAVLEPTTEIKEHPQGGDVTIE